MGCLLLIGLAICVPVGLGIPISTRFENKPSGNADRIRQDAIKEMMQFAWNGYKQFAWGANELAPNSKQTKRGAFPVHMGASIVDAADTLWLMGMHEEFAEARDWIQTSLKVHEVDASLSVFETNIRFLGGLLSAYALSKDKMFLEKARQFGDALLPAFDTPTGIPLRSVVPSAGEASGGCTVLSEMGSLELEMAYLSRISNDSRYVRNATRARSAVSSIPRTDGLYYNSGLSLTEFTVSVNEEKIIRFICKIDDSKRFSQRPTFILISYTIYIDNYVNPYDADWCSYEVSLGSLGDSFYEYLLKIWIFHGANPSHPLKEQFENAINALVRHTMSKSTPSSMWYFVKKNGLPQMEHFTCFSAGMFALKAMNEQNTTIKDHYAELAGQIGHTCHESYNRTKSGIGPDLFGFSDTTEAYPVDSSYKLRPESIESWFYLWRLTHNSKYREWCWDAAQAIQRNCRGSAGYSGLHDVDQLEPNINNQDDVQQSFFLAETLKYLFLVFGADDDFPLDKWVFNTEAHPFPIE